LKIIDAHLHFSDTLPLKNTAENIAQVEYTAKGLRREFAEAGVIAGIVMTTGRRKPGQGISQAIELTLEDGTLDCLLACVGINPFELKKNKNEIEKIERELTKDWVTGIKIYPGYFPFYAYDSIYEPVYELARQHNIPVAIHCGSTQSPEGLLKYSHPLNIDELAVKHRDINFVICHLGVPWVMDTAEIVAKNMNVYADLSGLCAGNKTKVKEIQQTEPYINYLKQSLVYAHSYDKLLFGTDWPLVPIKPYVEFIKELIPDAYREDVFYNNALRVFPKLRKMVG
jgi:predicted TIM-barrel fold metal-dependent hydrolase